MTVFSTNCTKPEPSIKSRNGCIHYMDIHQFLARRYSLKLIKNLVHNKITPPVTCCISQFDESASVQMYWTVPILSYAHVSRFTISLAKLHSLKLKTFQANVQISQFDESAKVLYVPNVLKLGKAFSWVISGLYYKSFTIVNLRSQIMLLVGASLMMIIADTC